MSDQRFPPGWDEARIRKVIKHDDSQDKDERAAEIEAAWEAEGMTVMSVPTELVPEPRARKNRIAMWHSGALFHASTRYPRKPRVARVDRLASILRNGLLAPASCPDGSAVSDLNLVVTGTAVPYDRLVFLHCFSPQSYIYTVDEPGRFVVFVDPAIQVLTPEAMGANWVVLCQDEVYVQDRIAPEHLIRVAVHSADAESVRSDLMADFQRLGIPLHDYGGNVLWQPARAENRLKSH